MRIIVFCLALPLFCQQVFADEPPVTGNDILLACAVNADDPMFCNAILINFADYAIKERLPNGNQLICMPTGSTLMQAAAVIKKQMTDYPQAMHLSMRALVASTLFNAFPCKK